MLDHKVDQEEFEKEILSLNISDEPITKYYSFGKIFGETTTTVVKRATSIKDPDLHVVVKIYNISKIKGYFYIIIQEILALKEADHPGIVKLLEVYRDSENIYLVMERLEKYTLSYIMEREE